MRERLPSGGAMLPMGLALPRGLVAILRYLVLQGRTKGTEQRVWPREGRNIVR